MTPAKRSKRGEKEKTPQAIQSHLTPEVIPPHSDCFSPFGQPPVRDFHGSASRLSQVQLSIIGRAEIHAKQRAAGPSGLFDLKKKAVGQFWCLVGDYYIIYHYH